MLWEVILLTSKMTVQGIIEILGMKDPMSIWNSDTQDGLYI